MLRYGCGEYDIAKVPHIHWSNTKVLLQGRDRVVYSVALDAWTTTSFWPKSCGASRATRPVTSCGGLTSIEQCSEALLMTSMTGGLERIEGLLDIEA